MTDPSADEPATTALDRAFERAGGDYDDNAELQHAIADELLERLAAVKIEPRTVVDLGCGGGRDARALQKMYRRADVIGVDPARGAPRRIGRWRPGRRPQAVQADLARLPLADASVDLVFSNLVCRWRHEPQALFTELRRVLRPEGVLMFSTLGPDTLWELREAWAVVDECAPLPELSDMHDIGDALLAAGLRDPVMDVDRLRRGYADPAALMRAIEAVDAADTGAEVSPGQAPAGTLERLHAAWPACDDSGGVLASWELVFGHAWGARTPRAGSGDAREYHVPIESIGRARRATDGD